MYKLYSIQTEGEFVITPHFIDDITVCVESDVYINIINYILQNWIKY